MTWDQLLSSIMQCSRPPLVILFPKHTRHGEIPPSIQKQPKTGSRHPSTSLPEQPADRPVSLVYPRKHTQPTERHANLSTAPHPQAHTPKPQFLLLLLLPVDSHTPTPARRNRVSHHATPHHTMPPAGRPACLRHATHLRQVQPCKVKHLLAEQPQDAHAVLAQGLAGLAGRHQVWDERGPAVGPLLWQRF